MSLISNVLNKTKNAFIRKEVIPSKVEGVARKAVESAGGVVGNTSLLPRPAGAFVKFHNPRFKNNPAMKKAYRSHGLTRYNISVAGNIADFGANQIPDLKHISKKMTKREHNITNGIAGLHETRELRLSKRVPQSNFGQSFGHISGTGVLGAEHNALVGKTFADEVKGKPKAYFTATRAHFAPIRHGKETELIRSFLPRPNKALASGKKVKPLRSETQPQYNSFDFNNDFKYGRSGRFNRKQLLRAMSKELGIDTSKMSTKEIKEALANYKKKGVIEAGSKIKSHKRSLSRPEKMLKAINKKAVLKAKKEGSYKNLERTSQGMKEIESAPGAKKRKRGAWAREFDKVQRDNHLLNDFT